MPALDGGIADPPLVGPREDARSGDATLERGPELPVEDLGLVALAFRRRPCVEADLTEHQWAISGQVLEARQIAAEVGLALEEHDGGQEVDRPERQILRSRAVGVG